MYIQVYYDVQSTYVHVHACINYTYARMKINVFNTHQMIAAFAEKNDASPAPSPSSVRRNSALSEVRGHQGDSVSSRTLSISTKVTEESYYRRSVLYNVNVSVSVHCIMYMYSICLFSDHLESKVPEVPITYTHIICTCICMLVDLCSCIQMYIVCACVCVY